MFEILSCFHILSYNHLSDARGSCQLETKKRSNLLWYHNLTLYRSEKGPGPNGCQPQALVTLGMTKIVTKIKIANTLLRTCQTLFQKKKKKGTYTHFVHSNCYLIIISII